MENLERYVREHPFFAGLDPALVELAAGCARNAHFDAGTLLFREGQAADEFYLLRHGSVALEIVAPARPSLVIATLHEGDLVGASWLVPPYRWNFDARATALVRAIAIDARCLREKCEADPRLGYQVLKRFLPVIVRRLQATRMQLLDVYGRQPA